jgi:two-component system, OmpR family, phosphate regulon sensor histidine kinase PhoR
MPAGLEFLNCFSTPLLVLTANGKGQWQVVAKNNAFEAHFPQANLKPATIGLNGLVVVESKKTYPLTTTDSTLTPKQVLGTLAGRLQTEDGNLHRVKLKHDWLDEDTLWIWVEPFSEDMALTQAHADFVSVVSHEFRTPLTSIKGFADTLLRYGANIDAEQQKRFVTIIKHQADRLTRLVENLLVVSKLGAQRTEFSFRPIGVKKCLERIIQTIEGKIKEPREIRLHISDETLEAWADPDKMEQVLTNLVDNAVKYSYPGSPVDVTAKLLPNDDDKITIIVQDYGVGIPKEHLSKMFSKFSRIDNPLTREVEGTGLGLFITKSLTLAMNGDIQVESEEGKGSTFTVILPVATPERQLAESLREQSSPETSA